MQTEHRHGAAPGRLRPGASLLGWESAAAGHARRLTSRGRQVGFVPLNIYDPESLQLVLSHVDNAIQYG